MLSHVSAGAIAFPVVNAAFAVVRDSGRAGEAGCLQVARHPSSTESRTTVNSEHLRTDSGDCIDRAVE